VIYSVLKNNGAVFSYNKCLDFDGVNDYSAIDDANDFRLNEGSGGKPMSWSMWLNPDALGTTNRGMLHKGALSNAGREWHLIYSNVSLYRTSFVIFGSSDGYVYIGRLCNSGDLVTGSWQHVAITYNGGSTIKIYINGVRKDTTDATRGTWTAPYSGSGSIYVGRSYFSSADRYYDGRQDELAIWSRELTLEEIQSLYNSGNGKPATSVQPSYLIGYWKNNAIIDTNKIADETANDRKMTLAAAPYTPQLVDR